MSARPPHRIFLGKDSHRFSSAHMTVYKDGTKERLHGHNFQVSVALDLRDTSFAAFLDFGVVKEAVAAQCREWDEKLILAERCPYMKILSRRAGDNGELEFLLCGRRYVVPIDEVVFLPIENVIVETLAIEFARALLVKMGQSLRKEIVAGLEVSVAESTGQGGSYYLVL